MLSFFYKFNYLSIVGLRQDSYYGVAAADNCHSTFYFGAVVKFFSVEELCLIAPIKYLCCVCLWELHEIRSPKIGNWCDVFFILGVTSSVRGNPYFVLGSDVGSQCDFLELSICAGHCCSSVESDTAKLKWPERSLSGK